MTNQCIVAGIQTDEHAKRFQQTWADVYTSPSLEIPWYLVAGNHDHYGNVTAQIEYSKQFTPDTGRSWNFPSLYHTKTFSADGVTVDLVFIDTVDLSGNTEGFEEVNGEENPYYYDPLPPRTRESAADQWDWIEAQLQSSTADYLFVAGHFPVYSVCQHGNTQNLIDNLKPLLVKYNVTGYLAGHDHCMSVVKEPDFPLYYIVSGNANFCCTQPDHLEDIPVDKELEWYAAGKKLALRGGFSTIRVPDLTAGLTIAFHDQDGELLHATDSVPPRTPATAAAAVAATAKTTSGASCTELNCGQYYMNCDCDAAGDNCACHAH